MPRFAEPYTLYPRRMLDGRRVWYYRARDPETGKRYPGRSTGKIVKADAYAFCEALRRDGLLIPGPREPKPAAEVRRSRRPPTLAEWAVERHWWEWAKDGPVCEYCKGEIKRSEAGAPAIQRRQADDSLRILRANILPALGDKRLDHVTPADCEALMASWSDEGASNKTINNRASVARVVFGEAARLSVIPMSPWDKVRGYRAERGGKGILSLAEYRALMSPATIGAVWSRGVYYDINLLASVTGLRLGECLDLHREDLHEDHVTVSGSWNIKYGEGPQKTKRGTDELPIPRYVFDRLAPALELTPPGGFLFSLSDGKRPCTGNRVNDALTAALGKVGIPDDERKARKLSFHSWRAFANTYFRARNVSDAKVRAITRHTTEIMTEHYTPWRPEDFREVAEAQAALVGELEKAAVNP